MWVLVVERTLSFGSLTFLVIVVNVVGRISMHSEHTIFTIRGGDVKMDSSLELIQGKLWFCEHGMVCLLLRNVTVVPYIQSLPHDGRLCSNDPQNVIVYKATRPTRYTDPRMIVIHSTIQAVICYFGPSEESSLAGAVGLWTGLRAL